MTNCPECDKPLSVNTEHVEGCPHEYRDAGWIGALAMKERNHLLETALKIESRHREQLDARISRMEGVFRELSICDLNSGNCDSMETASKRIRSIARQALVDGREPKS